MSGVFEFGKYPELFTGNNTVDIVCDIIINLVVCHSTDYYIIVMRFTVTAINNEVKPFFCHFHEFKNVESCIKSYSICVNGR